MLKLALRFRNFASLFEVPYDAVMVCLCMMQASWRGYPKEQEKKKKEREEIAVIINRLRRFS